MTEPASRHRVVVIGSGFGGLWATRALADAPVDITVIDRTTHHLFQPLLYQVATGILSEGEIAPPFRDIVSRQANARTILGEVEHIDAARRQITSRVLDHEITVPYDSLIVAAGARQSYFGHDEFERFAPGLKSIDDALELRGRIFGAFEMAEIETDPEVQRAWLTFVVVGGGPTGVEMAGQIAELSRRTLSAAYRSIDPSDARVVIVDGADHVLGNFGGALPRKAADELRRLGVEIHTGAHVTGVDEHGVDVDAPNLHRIASRTVMWAAGVSASPLGRMLAEQTGATVRRNGQIEVQPDLTLPGHPEIRVVGDMMGLGDLPGVAEVAMQSGRYAAVQIRRNLEGKPPGRPFRYRSLGNMASVSRFFAIAEFGPIRVSGLLGWLMWLVVHLTFLTGFKNRFTTLVHWTVTFVGSSRSERTITLRQAWGRTALASPADRASRSAPAVDDRDDDEDRDGADGATPPPEDRVTG